MMFYGARIQYLVPFKKINKVLIQKHGAAKYLQRISIILSKYSKINFIATKSLMKN